MQELEAMKQLYNVGNRLVWIIPSQVGKHCGVMA